jgi:hypothetical protein
MVKKACVIVLAWLLFHTCLVREQCYGPEDCDEGVCFQGSCMAEGDLPGQKAGLQCPAGMVSVEDRFCMDRYEASRPDASDSGQGVSDSLAVSRRGVIPWHGFHEFSPVTFIEASAACSAAGKRICSASEWAWACSGPKGTRYCYGDEYIPDRCNSIDAHCDSVYPGCYYDSTDYMYQIMPTGSFPACTSWCGVYDMSGNLWEWVVANPGSGIDYPHLRGGAYNCGIPGPPSYMLSCGFDGGTFRPGAGIRCCHDGITED